MTGNSRKKIGGKVLVFIFFAVPLIFSACSSSLEKSLFTQATYKRVYFAALDSVLESGFGILEADMGEGLIRAEQNVEGESEEAKFFIEVRLKDQRSRVDMEFEVTGPAFSSSEKKKALRDFKNGLKEKLGDSGGNL